MWTIKYSQEVRNYIYDSYPYTEQVWKAIKSLRDSADGLPKDGATQLEPNLFTWKVLNHLVVYRRISHESVLRFMVVKPIE